MLPQRFTFDHREHVDERRRRLLGVLRAVRKLAVLVTNVRELDEDQTVESHSHRSGRFVVCTVSCEAIDVVTPLAHQLGYDAGVIDSAFGQTVRDDETAFLDS